MSAWDQKRRSSNEPDDGVPAHSMTEAEILAAPEEHSRVVHGDDNFHADCAECREHGRAMMALFNLTPQEYLDSFDIHKRPMSAHQTLYNIAKACAEEDGDE